MCKMNDYIGGVAHYFSSMLGDNVAFRPAKRSCWIGCLLVCPPILYSIKETC